MLVVDSFITSKLLAVKVEIAVEDAIIFAVRNVDCVDGTPFDTRLSTVEMSSVAVDIDVSLVEVHIDIYYVDWIDVYSVD